MKKLAFAFTALIFVFLLSCSLAEESRLIEKGLDLAHLMSEIANTPGYLDAYTASPDILAQLDQVGDENDLRAVYQLKSKVPMPISTNDFSDALKADFYMKLYASAAAHINAQGGSDLLFVDRFLIV